MKISDCTLRDYVGSALTYNPSLDWHHIAELLSELDLDELEIGDPFSYKEDATFLKQLSSTIPVTTFYGPKRQSDLKVDLEYVKSLGLDGVIISIPASQQFAELKLPSADWAYRFELVEKAIEVSKDLGLYAVVTGEDSPSADIRYLKEYLTIVMQAGAKKFRYAESVSKSLPMGTYQRIKELLSVVPGAEIEMHCHDMFGLALANGIAGVEAGATWISGTMLGAGERGGNINTIDALSASKFLFNQTDRDLRNLSRVSRQLATMLGLSYLDSQRIIGERCFAFEQPLPLKHPQVYLPFDPREVGGEISVILSGKHSLETLEFMAEKFGITHDPAILAGVDAELRTALADTKKPLEENLVMRMFSRFTSNA